MTNRTGADPVPGRARGVRRARRWASIAILLIPCAGGAWGAGRDRVPAVEGIFARVEARDDQVVMEWDRARVREAARRSGLMRVRFPLPADLTIDLEIEPFAITGPRTRFVRGRRDAPDEAVDFDPASVSIFRGHVRGRAGSRVFLAFSEIRSTGVIDLGPGGRRWRIVDDRTVGRPSGRGRTAGRAGHPGVLDGLRGSAGRITVLEDRPSSKPPEVPLCGVEPGHADATVAVPGASAASSTPYASSLGPRRGLRHLELAVDTDHEFFILFGDSAAALTYLMQLYAEVSDIYIRDVDLRVELVFARIWDTPEDLFNVVEPSPLSDFQNHWNANMTGVQRDAAQLLSGRRDYPFGGQAYLGALCGSSAYSVAGYAMGFYPDPALPSVYYYDILVTAHELGHNCGTGHTQDSPNNLDTCHDPATTPQRGTIMSYCTQTWSGMNANGDNWFHAVIQGNIESYLAGALCVPFDCNLNSVDDAQDVAFEQSDDFNFNGIPDECEDCNGNARLDDLDIALGASPDVNANGIPDECEPDCNANGTPDAKDIADGTSTDLHGNTIPDECEADCDADGISDYTEIQASMPLDVDRDTVLDACQDCDADGTPDLAELDGAHTVWVASGLAGSVLRAFHPESGVLTGVSQAAPGAAADQAQDLIVTPGGRVLVTSKGDHRVMEFTRTGSFVGDLVASGSGGLSEPAGLTLTPDGATLLVAGSVTHAVHAYDAVTGASLGAFVAPGAGGLTAPFGLVFGPGGHLFVTSATNEVMEYDGTTGAFVRVFVTAADNGGLSQPRGIAFKGDGNLLVASYGTNQVLAYDGATGRALGRWALSGTSNRLDQISPWGIRVAPNGHVFVGRTGTAFGSGGGGGHHHASAGASNLHLTNAQIYEFDARNGNFLRAYIGGNDHGLSFPTGFDFVPGFGLDCNVNHLQDSCDIASGDSEDVDTNGVPDECESDCNGNGVQDRLDIIPYGAEVDCNANLLPDTCDLAAGTSADCTGNGIPDECEPDCNGNGIADSCDILSGAATDCNGNGVLATCDITDDLETDTGWTAGVAGDTATTGIWTRVDPIGTGAQPEDDHTPGAGRFCFVTGQGTPGGGVGENDVDGGTTTLVSPPFDLAGADESEVGYWRWFSNNAGGNPGEDVLRIDISNDNGSNWTTVETVGPTGAAASGGWRFHMFRVADVVTPTSAMRLRFVASDLGGGSIVEAGVDDLVIVPKSSGIPGEVQNLTVTLPGATRLDWTAQASGTLYDVVSGEVGGLIPAGVTDAVCLANGRAVATLDDARPDPPAGAAQYYLVRSEQSCNAGTYGIATSGAERTPVSACP